jgi:hypothetical protein
MEKLFEKINNLTNDIPKTGVSSAVMVFLEKADQAISTGRNTIDTSIQRNNNRLKSTVTTRPNYSTGSNTTGIVKPNYLTGSTSTLKTRQVTTTRIVNSTRAVVTTRSYSTGR